MKQLRALGLILLILPLLQGNLRAAGSGAFEGVVKDPSGKPIRGAEVRVETKSGSVISKTLTDAKGHYVSAAVPGGLYTVNLVISSVMKATMANQKATDGKATTLNFALTNEKIATGTPVKHQHRLYVPPKTGSNIGGHWIDVDDAGMADANHVETGDGRMLQKIQQGGGNVTTATGGSH